MGHDKEFVFSAMRNSYGDGDTSEKVHYYLSDCVIFFPLVSLFLRYKKHFKSHKQLCQYY